MIGLNQELLEREQQQKPVRVGMIGAGQMGVDVVAEVTLMKGINVVAIADIDIGRAESAYEIAGVETTPVKVSSASEADRFVSGGKKIYTDDYRVITTMKQIDVMLEATGVPDVGARAALLSACSGQQLAMMNVETDRRRVCSMLLPPGMNRLRARNSMILPIRLALLLWPRARVRTILLTGTPNPLTRTGQKKPAGGGSIPTCSSSSWMAVRR
jgi:hypothetical protein